MLDGHTIIGVCSKCGFSIVNCICDKKVIPFLSVTKKFKFDAAHKLPNYVGKCSFWHGHSWKLEIEFLGPVDERTGMVLDFSIVKDQVNELIINRLDHNSLNNIFENPTAEHITYWIVNMLESKLWGIGVELVRVRLYESEDSYTEWRKNK